MIRKRPKPEGLKSQIYAIDADKLATAVEQCGIDLAPTRLTWERLAAAVVTLAAGDGREAFHRMAAMWPDYDRRDSEQCYNRAQRRGDSVTDALWLRYRVKKLMHVDIFSSAYRTSGKPITIKENNSNKKMKNETKIEFKDISPTLLGERPLRGLSQLTDLLLSLFPQQSVINTLNNYLVGFKSLQSGVMNDAVIFWQVNIAMRVVNGKVIKYKFGGHRDKKFPPYLMYSGNGMCLFGEHLLNMVDQYKPVGIVESEKSAIIMSLASPGALWVATGSMSNFNEHIMAPLRGRLCVAFPDLDVRRGKKTGLSISYEQWLDKANQLNREGFKISVERELEDKANYPMRAEKMDVADVAIEEAKNKLLHNNGHV